MNRIKSTSLCIKGRCSMNTTFTKMKDEAVVALRPIPHT